ncbi:MAG: flagellin lysine-N-methylase [Clostridium sp.]|uniref:flagellin lysine-N-methylase n=1 Tax=Clostridium sp. TaxID=1506 RepID=UPI003F36D2FC
MRENILMPEYMKKFKCIGGACTDTCCKGWYISIDEDTYKKYKRVKNYEIKNKIDKYVIRTRSNKSKNNVAKMKLENNGCAFLREDGLCTIHGTLGEDYLSNTCKVYPRSFNKVNNIVEKSLSLSCIESSKVVLLEKEKMEFSFIEEEKKEYLLNKTANLSEEKKIWKDYFWDLRIFTIDILQNRNYKIDERLIILGFFYSKLDEKITENKINEIEDLIRTYKMYIDERVFDEGIKNINSSLDLQFVICKKILDIRSNTSITSEKYLEYLKKMLLGLNVKEGISIEESMKSYKEAHEKYYKPFIEENEHMLENYLVNHVFKNLFPIDEENPFKSYIKLVLHYAIIKLHLVGIGNNEEGLTEEIVVDVIQVISKTFEHNKAYFSTVLKVILDGKLDSLANMVILIKN